MTHMHSILRWLNLKMAHNIDHLARFICFLSGMANFFSTKILRWLKLLQEIELGIQRFEYFEPF